MPSRSEMCSKRSFLSACPLALAALVGGTSRAMKVWPFLAMVTSSGIRVAHNSVAAPSPSFLVIPFSISPCPITASMVQVCVRTFTVPSIPTLIWLTISLPIKVNRADSQILAAALIMVEGKRP